LIGIMDEEIVGRNRRDRQAGRTGGQDKVGGPAGRDRPGGQAKQPD